MMFMSARALRYIYMAVLFVTTRVNKLEKEDWGKLKRVLKFLRGTRKLKLALSVGDISVVKWWVDPSCAVHGYNQGHTGARTSLGK